MIIENIAGSPSSLGWVGLRLRRRERRRGQVARGRRRRRLRRADTGDDRVGEYPIARPLFIYVNADEAAARPELAAFVDFYLSDEGIAAVSEADYVALDDGALEETRAAWEGR